MTLLEEIKEFVDNISNSYEIPITLNIGFKNISGSITVGNSGTMLYGTFQPSSNTTEDFQINDNGVVFSYNTIKTDGIKWKVEEVEYGHYTEWFPKTILELLDGYIYWVFDDDRKKELKRKRENLRNDFRL